MAIVLLELQLQEQNPTNIDIAVKTELFCALLFIIMDTIYCHGKAAERLRLLSVCNRELEACDPGRLQDLTNSLL